MQNRKLLRSHSNKAIPRILTAVPICDGHDSAILTINLELARNGIEVIYLGYHRSVRNIVRAAIQEDVMAIGISSYNGGHNEFFSDVLRSLRKEGAGNIGLFGGGGGTITPKDAKWLKQRGVDEIFFAGTAMNVIINFVKEKYRTPRRDGNQFRPEIYNPDLALSRSLTAAQVHKNFPRLKRNPSVISVGITGPGGAGKTTLIDELTLRFLKHHPNGRMAILSHDPSLAGHGGVLADRATMVNAENDRVFMRSLATQSSSGGLARATPACLNILKNANFELILVESAGIGQEDLPFSPGLVDRQILVMSPDYGGRLQLQKIVMLEKADIIVVNKTDLPGAKTALSELEHRLGFNSKPQKIVATRAKVHRDPGVDELFTLLSL
jgi:methylmalonyl-CoA mutase cobalamin-binding domain/chain